MRLLAVILVLAATGCWSPLVPSPANTSIPTVTRASTRSPIPTPMQGTWATVTRVLDGDTVELDNGRRARYIGVNAPEQGQAFYEEAKEANGQLVERRQVLLEFDIATYDRYGRWLVYVYVDGRFVNYELVRRGFANVYTLPPNVKYEELLSQGQREAREEEAGLWASVEMLLRITHIEADAPGDDNDNPNGEWIEITNQGASPVDLAAYTLGDEANHVYVFDPWQLTPGATVRLHTGQGQDSEEDLYWGFVGRSVWNNSGDTAYLRDPQGNLVDVYTY